MIKSICISILTFFILSGCTLKHPVDVKIVELKKVEANEVLEFLTFDEKERIGFNKLLKNHLNKNSIISIPVPKIEEFYKNNYDKIKNAEKKDLLHIKNIDNTKLIKISFSSEFDFWSDYFFSPKLYKCNDEKNLSANLFLISRYGVNDYTPFNDLDNQNYLKENFTINFINEQIDENLYSIYLNIKKYLDEDPTDVCFKLKEYTTAPFHYESNLIIIPKEEVLKILKQDISKYRIGIKQ